MESVSLSPVKILREIGVSGDSYVADFGCGPGVFALPAATLTDGVVYAIDIRQDVLAHCMREASHENIDNIVPRHANLERDRGSELDSESVDFVIMRKVISQNENKGRLFREAHRVLKESGTLLVIGWVDGSPVGLAQEDLVSPESMRSLARGADFRDPRGIILNVHHFGIVFSK